MYEQPDYMAYAQLCGDLSAREIDSLASIRPLLTRARLAISQLIDVIVSKSNAHPDAVTDNKRLQEIVDRLPKTVDGEIIQACSEVYGIGGVGPLAVTVVGHKMICTDPDTDFWEPDPAVEYGPGAMFSTKEKSIEAWNAVSPGVAPFKPDLVELMQTARDTAKQFSKAFDVIDVALRSFKDFLASLNHCLPVELSVDDVVDVGVSIPTMLRGGRIGIQRAANVRGKPTWELVVWQDNDWKPIDQASALVKAVVVQQLLPHLVSRLISTQKAFLKAAGVEVT